MGKGWIRNGSRVDQKWVGNGPEMGPDYQKMCKFEMMFELTGL